MTYSEEHIRKRVHNLRKFYADLSAYGLIGGFSFFLWALLGGGYFWPIWIIIGWGMLLIVQAYSLGLLPVVGQTLPVLKSIQFLHQIFPFLDDEWEEEQVEKLYRSQSKREKVLKTPVATKSLKRKGAAKTTSSHSTPVQKKAKRGRPKKVKAA